MLSFPPHKLYIKNIFSFLLSILVPEKTETWNKYDNALNPRFL